VESRIASANPSPNSLRRQHIRAINAEAILYTADTREFLSTGCG
jgi:hypothetical protein